MHRLLHRFVVLRSLRISLPFRLRSRSMSNAMGFSIYGSIKWFLLTFHCRTLHHPINFLQETKLRCLGMKRPSEGRATFRARSSHGTTSSPSRVSHPPFTGKRRGETRLFFTDSPRAVANTLPSSRSTSGAAGKALPSPQRSSPCGGASCCRSACARRLPRILSAVYPRSS